MEYLFTFVFILYLAPWIVSEWRQREDSAAILTVNLVAGWTVVGWFGALWWAGADVLPERARPRPALHLVAALPETAAGPAARRRRVRVMGVMAVVGVAAALAAGGALLAAGSAGWLRAASSLPTERVAAAELVLRAAPRASAPAVGALPRGCVAAVTERHGEWRRLWRTADCPASARGRAAGWVHP